MRTRIVLGVLAVMAALAAPANSASVVSEPNFARELNAKLNVCNLCHGSNGTPVRTPIPVIWGQQENYLLKQLHDFHGGERKAEVMKWMAEALTADELTIAAKYFAGQKWPAKAAGAPAATAPRGMAVCQACHAQNFLGAVQAEGMSTPRLAGQSYDYLVDSMRRFAEGERTNNADMVQIMKDISPADREAMARYLSGL
jgi:cytochrome c553